MQRLRTHNETPTGGFRYRHAETGHVTEHVARSEWIMAAKAYRRLNNFPIGLNFEKEMEDQLCQTLPPGWCDQEVEPGFWARAAGSLAMTLESVKDGTRVLAAWMASGARHVSKEEANLRARTCLTCHFNANLSDCASCGMQPLNAIVAGIVGGAATEYDSGLHNCQICHCNLRAKVQIPSDILFSKTDPAVLERLPEWCWSKPKVA